MGPMNLKVARHACHICHVTCVTCVTCNFLIINSHVTHVTHVTWVTLVKLLVHKSHVTHVTHVTGISCWNFCTKIQKKHVTGTRNTRMSHLSLLCPIMSLIWKCYLNDKEHFHFHGGLCKISIEIECLVNVS